LSLHVSRTPSPAFKVCGNRPCFSAAAPERRLRRSQRIQELRSYDFHINALNVGMAIVHLHGHCCPKSGLRGVPFSHCSLETKVTFAGAARGWQIRDGLRRTSPRDVWPRQWRMVVAAIRSHRSPRPANGAPRSMPRAWARRWVQPRAAKLSGKAARSHVARQ
jgi:hypothetical protein